MNQIVIGINGNRNSSVFSFNFFVHILIFLFPIFAVNIKSWTSTLHVLLFFTSIYWLFKNSRIKKPPLISLEKLFLILLATIFVWYICIELVNGWRGIKSHWPLIEFRYVMIIPIFLMLRNMPNLNKWLIYGAILGCIFILSYATYQTYYLEVFRPSGAYNILFLGPVSAIFSLLILYSSPQQWNNQIWKYLAFIAILCGIGTLAMSAPRSGMLAAIIIFSIYPILTEQASLNSIFKYLLILFVILVATFYLFDPVKLEVQHTMNSFEKHFKHLSMSKENFHNSRLDGITKRFAMWKAALDVSNDNKLFGVGRSGFGQLLKDKIASGEIHPNLKGIDQPHNAFLYHLVTRGYIGLFLFIAVLLLPLLMFIKNWQTANITARLGVAFILFFSIVSLTQSSVFARGHYLSFYLVVLVILLSSSITTCQKSKKPPYNDFEH